MEYIKTFGILAVFLILSVACIFNLIRHHNEEKVEKQERRRRRSPYADQEKLSEPGASFELDEPKEEDNKN